MPVIWQKLQKQDIQIKKAVAYVALFVLAVPLIILVGWNFQKRLSNFKGEEFAESLQMPQSQTATSDFSQQFTQDLNEAFLSLEQEMASSSQATTTN